MKASSYEGVVSNGVIFVSYSSLDREIVNALVQEFLPDDKISEGIRTLNLSADDPSSRMRISVGKNLWKHIRENLGETVCFIAFLSDNYFKSNLGSLWYPILGAFRSASSLSLIVRL